MKTPKIPVHLVLGLVALTAAVPASAEARALDDSCTGYSTGLYDENQDYACIGVQETRHGSCLVWFHDADPYANTCKIPLY